MQAARATVRAAILLFAVPALAGAQAALPPEPATRDEALRQLRQAKARRSASYTPGRLEKWVTKIENDRLLEDWLTAGEGGRYYVKFGGLVSGAGLAAGPGVRLRRLAGGHIDVNAWAVFSYRKYVHAEASVRAPRLAGGRLHLGGYVGRKYYPQEDFFGIGPASNRGDRVSFMYRDRAVGGVAEAILAPPLLARATVEYLTPEIGSGKDSRYPSIEERFTDETAPGLATQPSFLMTRGELELDYASPPGNPRRGGRYFASAARYTDRDTGHYSYDRFDVDLRQYLPFLQERRVIVLRAVTRWTRAGSGGEVPFYAQPTLGGSRTLRGFRDYRFRDLGQILLQAEYRWEILPALDAALFYDTGKVAPRFADLRLKHLERDYGFGFRIGTNRGVFLRVDAAFGSSGGPHYFIKLSHVF